VRGSHGQSYADTARPDQGTEVQRVPPLRQTACPEERRVTPRRPARHTMSDCFARNSMKTLTGALASPSHKKGVSHSQNRQSGAWCARERQRRGERGPSRNARENRGRRWPLRKQRPMQGLRQRLVSLERATGIEPVSEAWEASILPLNYARSARAIVLRDRLSVQGFARRRMSHAARQRMRPGITIQEISIRRSARCLLIHAAELESS
jgi:hypothetical protein